MNTHPLKTNQLPLSHVNERDIDLILVEELNCSERFRNWFLARVLKSLQLIEAPKFDEFLVQHSLGRRTKAEGKAGETDIHVCVTVNGLRVVALVENKLDSSFTTKQPERYLAEAQSLVRAGTCDKAVTVLLCPESYDKEQPQCRQFQVVIHYEELSTLFRDYANGNAGELGRRYDFRRYMVDHAIGRERRGYQPEADRVVTEFYGCYYALVQQEAPMLRMFRPGTMVSGSRWIEFHCVEQVPSFPAVTLRHKMRQTQSCVDLEIKQLGARFDTLLPFVQPMLESDMEVRCGQVRRGDKPPLIFSVPVPPVDVYAPFGQQRERILECLRAATRLCQWYSVHLPDLRRLKTKFPS